MNARRTLAASAIVVIVVAFVGVGVAAALVAGRELSKTDPVQSVTPTPSATVAP